MLPLPGGGCAASSSSVGQDESGNSGAPQFRALSAASASVIGGVELTTPDGSVWEQNLIPYELQRLFADDTFIWGGDLNTDPRMDDEFKEPHFLGGNRRLFQLYEEAGFRETRKRFYRSYQQTYVGGKRPFQLDHVFADARTEPRIIEWEVDLRPATEPETYSDHGAILVTLAS